MKIATFLIALSLCLPVFAADEKPAVITAEDFRAYLEAELSDLSQYRLSGDPCQEDRPHDSVPPPDEPGKLFRVMGWATYGTSAADIVTTELSLARGGHERNPYMRNRAVRIGSHIVVPVAVNKATEYIRKKGLPRYALWIRIAAVGMWGFYSARNIHIASGLE